MSRFKQIKLLFFHDATVNPYVWIFPFVFLPHLFFGTSAKYSDFGFSSSNTITILWLPMFLASMFFGAGMALNRAAAQQQFFATEFILTRAVDRTSVYWSRAAVYWCLMLIPAAVWLVIGLKQPSFTLEVSPDRLSQYLQMLPGSFIEQTAKDGDPVLMVPSGELWLNLWSGFQLIFVAAVFQLYICVTAGLRWAQYYYLAGLMVGICTPVFGRPAIDALFFSAVNHPALFLVALAAVVAASLAISKHRFLDQEF